MFLGSAFEIHTVLIQIQNFNNRKTGIVFSLSPEKSRISKHGYNTENQNVGPSFQILKLEQQQKTQLQ